VNLQNASINVESARMNVINAQKNADVGKRLCDQLDHFILMTKD